ncbi:MAG TPA: hypothetical protein VHP38_14360 [Ruminiclostridium sp.]|nr:hypothetical protein [Ruminiclostridium sp.]
MDYFGRRGGIMSKVFVLSNLLQGLIWMPLYFFVMQFILPPDTAAALSGFMVVMAVLASLICRLKIKAYLYNIISLAVSVCTAFIFAGNAMGKVIVALLSITVFMRIWFGLRNRNDYAVQTALIALFMNIAYAVINRVSLMKDSVGYGNAAILISVISSVIVLIVRQVDDSRSFGKASMDISKTQRRNNQIFGGILILALVLMGTVGRVSELYKFIITLIGKIFGLFGKLLNSGYPAPGQQQAPNFPAPEAASPGLFDKIMRIVLDVMAVALIAAFTLYLFYVIAKLIIKLVRKIAKWLGNKEKAPAILNENGLIDEKQSLYGRNIKNIADRFLSRARNLFGREVPYGRLPDGKAKVRRLFRYFISNSAKMGVSVKRSSTADEICAEASAVQPVETEFNELMAKTYNSVRYGDSEPVPDELKKLEDKLLT